MRRATVHSERPCCGKRTIGAALRLDGAASTLATIHLVGADVEPLKAKRLRAVRRFLPSTQPRVRAARAAQGHLPPGPRPARSAAGTARPGTGLALFATRCDGLPEPLEGSPRTHYARWSQTGSVVCCGRPLQRAAGESTHRHPDSHWRRTPETFPTHLR